MINFSYYRNTMAFNICHYHQKFKRSLCIILDTLLKLSLTYLDNPTPVLVQYYFNNIRIPMILFLTIIMVKSEYCPRCEYAHMFAKILQNQISTCMVQYCIYKSINTKRYPKSSGMDCCLSGYQLILPLPQLQRFKWRRPSGKGTMKTDQRSKPLGIHKSRPK